VSRSLFIVTQPPWLLSGLSSVLVTTSTFSNHQTPFSTCGRGWGGWSSSGDDVHRVLCDQDLWWHAPDTVHGADASQPPRARKLPIGPRYKTKITSRPDDCSQLSTQPRARGPQRPRADLNLTTLYHSDNQNHLAAAPAKLPSSYKSNFCRSSGPEPSLPRLLSFLLGLSTHWKANDEY